MLLSLPIVWYFGHVACAAVLLLEGGLVAGGLQLYHYHACLPPAEVFVLFVWNQELAGHQE